MLINDAAVRELSELNHNDRSRGLKKLMKKSPDYIELMKKRENNESSRRLGDLTVNIKSGIIDNTAVTIDTAKIFKHIEDKHDERIEN